MNESALQDDELVITLCISLVPPIQRQQCPEESAPFFSRITWWWMTRLDLQQNLGWTAALNFIQQFICCSPVQSHMDWMAEVTHIR